ncbi:MAG: DUF3524 domain-containing protein [Candidatus Latescibacterota bacterium]|jgi:glycosyltransferase involved in cell wall biosynthesis
MKILALEPYYGGSHKVFLDGLVEHSRHEILPITMTARFWKWRMQGGAVTLARKANQAWDDGFKPDLIFATDMVNLPAFLSLTRDQFSDTPVVFFFHENQLTYPMRPEESRDFTYSYINYLSCLAADRIVFNSQFHHDEFHEALPDLLRMFPDYTHFQTVRRIRKKSTILHLGIKLKEHDVYDGTFPKREWGPGMKPPVILWNQRWEFDKNPEAFFRIMNRLDNMGCKFRLILAGEHFEEQPEEFDRAFQRYADRILHYGYAEDFDEYSQLLHRSDIVVSTSKHEFFGIAILEAIYCGCHPLLPNRLTYPEMIPKHLHQPLLHAPVLYEDDEQLFEILRSILQAEQRPLPHDTLRGIPEHLDWREQVKKFDALFEDTHHGRENGVEIKEKPEPEMAVG